TITDDFDKDFDVDEWHGTNAFIRESDRIFRTYLINARGDEQMGNTWNYLDITALGRQEEWEDSPEGSPQTPPYGWWNYHDAYPEGAATQGSHAQRADRHRRDSSALPCGPSSGDHDLELGRTDVSTQLSLALLHRCLPGTRSRSPPPH